MLEKAALPKPAAADEPYALRGALFTTGFLVLVLALVPAVFYLAGEWRPGSSAGAILTRFFAHLRNLIGISAFSIGLTAYLFCSIWLMFFGRGPHVEFDPPKVFVATGPYRWVRNPVAISLIVTAAGEAIYFSSLGLAVFVALGMAFAHYQATRIEEPRLRVRFGEVYEQYCRKVPRWLPRPPEES